MISNRMREDNMRHEQKNYIKKSNKKIPLPNRELIYDALVARSEQLKSNSCIKAEDDMIKLNCSILHQSPQETIISLTIFDGSKEEVVVSTQEVVDSKLTVAIIDTDHEKYLVELPRESVSGKWRVWVKKEDIITER